MWQTHYKLFNCFSLSERLSLDATNVATILNKRVNLASRYNFADLCNLVGFNCKRVTYALAGSLDKVKWDA